MRFEEIAIGTYFTTSKGLLWRKVSETEAIDIWSGRRVKIIADVVCNIQAKED